MIYNKNRVRVITLQYLPSTVAQIIAAITVDNINSLSTEQITPVFDRAHAALDTLNLADNSLEHQHALALNVVKAMYAVTEVTPFDVLSLLTTCDNKPLKEYATVLSMWSEAQITEEHWNNLYNLCNSDAQFYLCTALGELLDIPKWYDKRGFDINIGNRKIYMPVTTTNTPFVTLSINEYYCYKAVRTTISCIAERIHDQTRKDKKEFTNQIYMDFLAVCKIWDRLQNSSQLSRAQQAKLCHLTLAALTKYCEYEEFETEDQKNEQLAAFVLFKNLVTTLFASDKGITMPWHEVYQLFRDVSPKLRSEQSLWSVWEKYVIFNELQFEQCNLPNKELMSTLHCESSHNITNAILYAIKVAFKYEN